MENIQQACAGSTTRLLSMVPPIVEQMVCVYSSLLLILDYNTLSLSETVTGHMQQNAEQPCLHVNVAHTCNCALKNNLCAYILV